MNKRIYLFFLLCTLGGAYCLAETKALSKSSMKNYKNECKQLKKDGWKFVTVNDLLEYPALTY